MNGQIHAAFTGKPPLDRKSRRRTERRESQMAVVLTPVGTDAFERLAFFGPLSVQLHDWSADGAGLLSQLPLDVCTTYRVEAGQERQVLPGHTLRVVACTRNADGWYRIGAVWTQANATRMRVAG